MALADTIIEPPRLAAERTLLRVTTAGSVDDGKSTLIGRLLYDCQALARDQLEQVERASKRRGHARTDLSLVTDGLRAEREQGITIDVAWRYFATPGRRFVLADTPGHEQYTRNMVTGCSTADVAIVLVDARHGLKDQSRRHLAVAALLGVRTIVVSVNKMDLVGFDLARFEQIVVEARRAVARVNDATVIAVPISAIAGDNVVERSTRMAWYAGPPLLELLESLEPDDDARATPFRMAVQWVVRPQRDGFEDYRGFAGRIAAGTVRVGDPIRVHPSWREAQVARLEAGGRDVDQAMTGESVILHLDRDVDVSRGELLARADEPPPQLGRDLDADLVWLADVPARVRGHYRLKHGTRTQRAVLGEIAWLLDVSTLERSPARPLGPNDVSRVKLSVASPMAWDPYTQCRTTGSFVLIDEHSGDTVAAGMLRAPPVVPHD